MQVKNSKSTNIVTSNNCFDKKNQYRIINEPRFLNDTSNEKQLLPKWRTCREAVIDAGIRAGIFDLYQHEQDPNISKNYNIIASQLIRAYYEASDIVRIDEVSLDCYDATNVNGYLKQIIFSTNKAREFIEYYKTNVYCDKKSFISNYNFNFNILLLRNIEFHTYSRILNGVVKQNSEINSDYRNNIWNYNYYFANNREIPYFFDKANHNYDVIKFIPSMSIHKIVLKGVFEYGAKLTMQDNILQEKCLEHNINNINKTIDFITDLNISDYENLLSLAVPAIKASLNQQLTDTDIKISEDAKARLNKTTKQTKLYF